MNSPVSADPSISDDEEEMDLDDSKPKCSNCGILCHITHTTPKGNFCGTCHQVCIIIRVQAKGKLVKTITYLISLSYYFFSIGIELDNYGQPPVQLAKMVQKGEESKNIIL